MQQTVCRLSADCDLKCSLELTPDRQPAGRRPGGLPSNQDMVRACSVAISSSHRLPGAFRFPLPFPCAAHPSTRDPNAAPYPRRVSLSRSRHPTALQLPIPSCGKDNERHERALCAAGRRRLARASHRRCPRLLLQSPDQGHPVDQARGSHEPCRGTHAMLSNKPARNYGCANPCA
jgi:hypothetical protein